MNGTSNWTDGVPFSNTTAASVASTSYLNRWSHEFWARNWNLVLILMMELLLVGGLYIYHIMWVKIQKQQAKNSAVMRLTEAYSLDLLRRFLPSAKVEKYRFRGLTKKAAVASVSFEDISLELPNGERILQGVSGEFRAGRMCAIMGPSGAGKTSLMNVLCGKANYGRPAGIIRFNGKEGHYDDYKTVMGFVPQEDIVHEGLTVGEQIRFSAELRNSSGADAHHRKLITEDVLNVMQLDYIQNSLVGGLEQRGISGGQRKRVSIGLELAADPTMLFLDEPTSGLDASSSLAIVHSLKRMAQLGMTSIMVVHQPRYSLYSLFDDVLLLGRGGRTVYLGPALGAKQYFQRLGFAVPESENPADWFMDLITGDVPNHKIPHFVPELLFDLWEANKHSVQRSLRARENAMMEVDEWEELMRALDEDWPLISYKKAPSAMDPGRKGVLREADLYRVLKPCIDQNGQEEEEDVKKAVRQLLSRIAGPAALVATKNEVLEFLAGLQGVVAADKNLNRLKNVVNVKQKASSRSVGGSSVVSHMTSDPGTPCSGISEKLKFTLVPNISLNAGLSGRKQPSVIPEEDSGTVALQISARSTQNCEQRSAQRVLRPEGRHGAAPSDDVLVTFDTDGDYSLLDIEAERTSQSVLPETAPLKSKSGRSLVGKSQEAQPAAGDQEPPEEEISDHEDPAWLPTAGCTDDAIIISQLPPEPSPRLTLPAMPSRISGGLWPQVVPQRPKEFSILLDNGDCRSLGAIVSNQDGTSLKVKSIMEGRIKEWNEANPGLQVKKGDQILAANGIHGDAEAMLEECCNEAALNLSIRTREHRRSKDPSGRASQRLSSENGSERRTMTEVCWLEADSPLTLLGRVSPPPAKLPSVPSPKDLPEGQAGSVEATEVDGGGTGDMIPKLKLGVAPMPQAEEPRRQVSAPPGPRGLHASSGETAKARLGPREGAGVTDFLGPEGASPLRGTPNSRGTPHSGPPVDSGRSRPSSRGRRNRSSRSSAEGSSSRASSDISSDSEAPFPIRVSGEELAKMQLSPRTRAVWTRQLSSQPASARDQEDEGASSDGMSEDRLSLAVVLEVSFAEEDCKMKVPALPATKSFASAGQLHRVASNSKAPGFFTQLRLLLHRSFIQWWRGNWHRGIFLFVIFGSSVILGLLDTFVQKEAEWQVLPYLNMHTTLALLTCVFCLNVFGSDRPVFWRERESGLSVAAFYVSKTFANMFDLLLQCFLLGSVYYIIRQPLVPFTVYFPPFLLVSFAASGVGYVISALFPVKHGPFIAAITIFVFCGLLGHPLRVETMADGGPLEFIMDIFSITRWSIAFYFKNYLDGMRADHQMAMFESDPAAMAAINGIESIYRRPKLIGEHILGMRSEVVFLMGMALVWHVLGYLILSFGNRSNRHQHRRASPWKQRLHRAKSFAHRAAAPCRRQLGALLGEERQEDLSRAWWQFKQHLWRCTGRHSGAGTAV
eukprot:CAMPEP_0115067726 /NCGR_PEP_ID=MMETSP0227-20121206/11565_1 /TAXON_ID=89957 /ORGANISM="Polarella glacialis, Strain CCMP 1383" /LENGTH=1459 /DNA_ID=CAMNT_0002453855 /DNA_START=67 /DNA_END=4446 /DNA_ORIENTATION=+